MQVQSNRKELISIGLDKKEANIMRIHANDLFRCPKNSSVIFPTYPVAVTTKSLWCISEPFHILNLNLSCIIPPLLQTLCIVFQ